MKQSILEIFKIRPYNYDFLIYIYIYMLCCNPKSLIVKYSRILCRRRYIADPCKFVSQLSLNLSFRFHIIHHCCAR
jgi:hypothetical protein